VSTYLYRFSYRQVQAVNIAPNFDKNNIQLLFQTARVEGPGLSTFATSATAN